MQSVLNDELKKKLLKLARDTILLYLKNGKIFEPRIDDAVLNEIRGVFVTLSENGNLRGCIGNIIGTKPLCIGVRDMAIASATQDPRFPSVKLEALGGINIEISALSPLEKISDPSKIALGTHGVLVRDDFRSGVYLPQVATETGWSKEEFMNSLCVHKAGMDPDAWKKGECDIYVFTAQVFGE